LKKRGLSSRIMSVLLSLMMLLSLLPTAVLADESATKTYTKVTSADELVTGEYVMVANNGYRCAGRHMGHGGGRDSCQRSGH